VVHTPIVSPADLALEPARYPDGGFALFDSSELKGVRVRGEQREPAVLRRRKLCVPGLSSNA